MGQNPSGTYADLFRPNPLQRFLHARPRWSQPLQGLAVGLAAGGTFGVLEHSFWSGLVYGLLIAAINVLTLSHLSPERKFSKEERETFEQLFYDADQTSVDASQVTAMLGLVKVRRRMNRNSRIMVAPLLIVSIGSLIGLPLSDMDASTLTTVGVWVAYASACIAFVTYHLRATERYAHRLDYIEAKIRASQQFPATAI